MDYIGVAQPSERVDHAILLEKILRKRRDVARSRTDLFWCVVNFFISCGLIYEMSFGYFVLSMSFNDVAVWPTASAISVLCFSSFVIYFWRYIKFWFFSVPVNLTVSQQKAFGVSNTEHGFLIIQPAQVENKKSCLKNTPVPNFSPSVYTGRSSFQQSPSRSVPRLDQSRNSTGGISPFSGPSLLYSRQGSIHSTPPSYSGSPGCYAGGSGNRSSSLSAGPLDMTSGSLRASFNSPSLQPVNRSPGSSPTNALGTAYHHTMFTEMSGVQKKNRSPTVSPLRTDSGIQDLSSLDLFLREQQEKDSKLVSGDLANNSTQEQSSFWSYGRSMSDMLPMLRGYQYQLAPRNLLTTSGVDNTSSQTDSPSCEHVWTKMGVMTDQLDRWVENLRKWLGKTILSQIVNEIDEINRLLVRHGSEDVQIGEASLSSLKQISVVKSQHVPQLLALIPYIDMIPNQEYLIHRIRDLADGGCLSAFKWNGGVEFKGKRWDESLPTDSAILIHLLCSYLDARLPAHPKYPDGKTFTSQHFISTPDKPNLIDRKDNLCIYRTHVNPPHFKVVIEDTVWNVKEGRHNLFHAILLFLYHIKVKEHGMLRRINLGMSGINISWIFEQ